jgi:hypothetical protein
VCDACRDVIAAPLRANVAQIGARHGLAVDGRFNAVDSNGKRQAALEALASKVSSGCDVRLMCWCAPKRCHADAIAERVRQMCLAADAGIADAYDDDAYADGDEYGADAELRVDTADGNAYPLESFVEAYGGTEEWDRSLAPHPQ